MRNKQYFEGIKVRSCRWLLPSHTAITLPGWGIFISGTEVGNVALLRHEFGHILQYRHFGKFFFWSRVAPVSLWSAVWSCCCPAFHHCDTWTEWSANRLSYIYWGKPASWPSASFPLLPSRPRRLSFFPHSTKLGSDRHFLSI